jgi:hypothetical protein
MNALQHALYRAAKADDKQTRSGSRARSDDWAVHGIPSSKRAQWDSLRKAPA